MVKYIKRIKNGNSYIYFTNNNKKIINKNTLNKIKKIYVAPAYKNVKIFLDSDVLATGIDEAGRKQYVYSNKMKEKRDNKKYKKLLKMVDYIDKLKNKIKKDLNEKNFTKNKLVALALKIMDICNFRSGNKKYEKKYGSYGITTLHKKHISIKNNSVEIEFIGKKGVNNHCIIKDKIIIDLIKQVYSLSSKDNSYFFSINDKKNNSNNININVGDINTYLKEFHITTKDLRTWNANFLFLNNLQNEIKIMNNGLYNKKTDLQKLKMRKSIIKDAIIKTAESLHHTATICKSSYINKTIIKKIENSNIIFLSIKNNKDDTKNLLKKFLKN
jgi:DNA topoisomerase-1